jgi:hypothetical protein
VANVKRQVLKTVRGAAFVAVPGGIACGLNLMGLETPQIGFVVLFGSLAYGAWAILSWSPAMNALGAWLMVTRLASCLLVVCITVGAWALRPAQKQSGDASDKAQHSEPAPEATQDPPFALRVTYAGTTPDCHGRTGFWMVQPIGVGQLIPVNAFVYAHITNRQMRGATLNTPSVEGKNVDGSWESLTVVPALIGKVYYEGLTPTAAKRVAGFFLEQESYNVPSGLEIQGLVLLQYSARVRLQSPPTLRVTISDTAGSEWTFADVSVPTGGPFDVGARITMEPNDVIDLTKLQPQSGWPKEC